MKIALDATGGDHAPESNVKGALLALQQTESGSDKIEVTLVGQKSTLTKLLPDELPTGLKFLDINSDRAIPGVQQESGRDAGSPIRIALRMHSEGFFDGVVSAGPTGSQVIASLIELGKCRGITRPAVGSLLPTAQGKCFLIDIGASLKANPHHLVQFALMGFIYVREFLGIEEPRVGLLNVGIESNSGSAVNIEANKLLSEGGLNYKGFIEGRDIPAGIADVIVTNGFVGNVLLKYTEGLPVMLEQHLNLNSKPNSDSKLSQDFDFQAFGGEPLLGVNGVSVICHGASSERAISASIQKAAMLARIGLHDKLETFLLERFRTYFSQVKYLRSFRRSNRHSDKLAGRFRNEK